MINLDSLKESLQKITRRRIITGDPLSEEDLEALLDLRTQIVDYFKVISLPKSIQQEQSVFARLSGTSGKNEISLEPLNSDMDVLHFMTNNRLFLNQEYNIDNKTTYLIMMPWNDQLNERYEFRIFVHNGKLTGISPQKWFALFQYSEEEIETIVEAMSNLRFLDDIPYKTLVADVWVNINGTQECYLIECNPFGAH